MLKREEVVGLLIGLLISAIVGLFMLPTDKELVHNAYCIDHCKSEIKRGSTQVAIYSSFTYLKAISQCYETCLEEKNGLQ